MVAVAVVELAGMVVVVRVVREVEVRGTEEGVWVEARVERGS
jgi:hypothetical protein